MAATTAALKKKIEFLLKKADEDQAEIRDLEKQIVHLRELRVTDHNMWNESLKELNQFKRIFGRFYVRTGE